MVETTEPLEQVEATETVAEVAEEVVIQTDASQEGTETDDEDFGWEQPTLQHQEAESKPDEKDVQISELQKRVTELENQLKENVRPEYNTLIKAMDSYFDANPESDIAGFIKQVSGISTLHGLSDEQKVERYFKMKAEKIGLRDAELEQAVAEEVEAWASKGKLAQKETLLQAEKELNDGQKGTLEEIAESYDSVAKKAKIDFEQFSKRQVENFDSFMEKVREKKRFNNRPVTVEWEKKMRESFLRLTPIDQTVVYASTKDANGYNDIHIEATLRRLDYTVNYDELVKTTKKKIDSVKADTLIKESVAAHSAVVDAEKSQQMTEAEERKQRFLQAVDKNKQKK